MLSSKNTNPNLRIQQIRSVYSKAGFWVPALVFLLTGWVLIFTLPKEVSFRWLTHNHSPWLDVAMRNLTYLGDGLMLVLTVLIFLGIDKSKSWRIALAGIFTSIVVQSLKHGPFNQVARPSLHFSQIGEAIRAIPGVEQHAMNSFPSGHAASAFALFWMLTLLNTRKRYAFPFFMLALTAAFSRVYLGQHFFNDIVAGATIGMAVSSFVFWLWPVKIESK